RTPVSVYVLVHEMIVAGPEPNRSHQLNGLSSSLKLMVPFLILSLRTLSPSRYRYSDVSNSQAWAQPPGNLLWRQRGRNVLSTVSRFHHAARTHSASVSRLVRRATRSRLGMFDPWPFNSTIFLKPW